MSAVMQNTQNSWSKQQLLLGMAVSAGAAFVLLVTIVLPAEFGKDPTGIGRMLGLDAMGGHHHEDAGPSAVAHFSDTPFATDQVVVALAPGEEVEFKAKLEQGAAMLYDWQVDRGGVYSDFHSEGGNAASQHRKRDAASQGRGSLTAPFSGAHGWYWVNRNDFPVNITVKLDGFYTDTAEFGRSVSD